MIDAALAARRPVGEDAATGIWRCRIYAVLMQGFDGEQEQAGYSLRSLSRWQSGSTQQNRDYKSLLALTY